MTSAPTDSTIESQVIDLIDQATRSFLVDQQAEDAPFKIELQVPRKAGHGDWATNVAMRLAKPLRRKPIEIAEGICANVAENDLIAPPEVAPPGFINLRLSGGAAGRTLDRVLAEADLYGRSTLPSPERIQVEFVSANPTGPMHIGHGRNAVVGDTLARIYQAAGYEVDREYYFNDAGVQMNLLGESLKARYLQHLGKEAPIPENGYKGDYLADIARALAAEHSKEELEGKDTKFFTDYAAQSIMVSIREDLDKLGIVFDNYFSETSLHDEGKVEQVIKRLRENGSAYEKDGALWLKTTDFGDDKDRVVVKSDGATTYLTPDVAYHEDKYKRGYSRLVNIWGADHHGYLTRLRAAVASLGHDPDKLRVVFIQMVAVEEAGKKRKLSTRSGDFVPLREILDELTPDVVRFFFLLRAPASQMTFDLDLARKTSMDNPYFYLQYAHARCQSLMERAKQEGQPWRPDSHAVLDRLSTAEEKAIVFQLGLLPGAITSSADNDDALPLLGYLRNLATSFHSYYSAGNKDVSLRCIQFNDHELTQARLTLIAAFRQTMANGLRVLGLTPIDRL